LDDQDDLNLEPDEELDNWPDDVKPDHFFKPDQELNEWKSDVEEDPSWNEHNYHANESGKPVESKINWSKYELVHEVWNEHDQIPDELHNWEHDTPDDVEDDHMDNKNESDGKFNDHVWNAQDPHPEAMQVKEEVENWQDNVEQEEVSDHNVELEDEVNNPYDSYNQSKVEHEEKSDEEEDQVQDPSWD